MRMNPSSTCLIFFFFFLLAPISPIQAQDITTFILVRHAEKMEDNTKDPALSEEGVKRAARLTDHLKKTDISAVYSTPYQRTRSTVEAIAKQRELSIREYNPFANDLVQQLYEEHKGGIVIISGHSNTTPNLVNQLLGRKVYEQLDESDYDNLYLVSITEVGKGQVIHLSF